MTEPDWLACDEPDTMLDFLLDRVSDRKFRLFACACLRRHSALLSEYKWAAKALEAAEKFADGQITQAQMNRAAAKFDAAAEEEELDDPADRVSTALWHLMNACKAIEGAAWAKSKSAAYCAATAADRSKKARATEVAAQVRLLRCIANPFHAVTPASSALAVQLARAAYDERLSSGELDPERLLILADALEDAGNSGAILAHLRSPGPHARGCWAVDLVLGYS